MSRFKVLLASIGLVLGLAACSAAVQLDFSADLTTDAEVPAPDLDGATPSGSATATLNEAEDTLTISGDFSGLTGPATGAHIHGPAEEGETEGVVFPLNVDAAASGELSGTWDDITEDEVQQLRDGLFYVNVHTDLNAAGEIRGQLK
ncbi:MAG: CHRD domain-containing protein [Trueperaceae bacterium]|nr:CHRD domain-containing protein [Trueperaceae bacterium]